MPRIERPRMWAGAAGAALIVSLTGLPPAAAVTAPAASAGVATSVAASRSGGERHHLRLPSVIKLPDGWGAEGIATNGSTVYSGSLSTGAVWRGDLRTGKGAVLVPAHAGRVSVGLKFSRGLLYVAGGATGQAHVYDARTGADVASYLLATGTSFINDVVVTRRAAYFTDSSNAVLYVVKLRNGRPVGKAVSRSLHGDWVQVANSFNANGIAATEDGRRLLVVNSTTGHLFRVDPASGRATRVSTSAELTAGDGILLRGTTLYVVRNQFNQIAQLKLDKRLTRARLVDTLTDKDFAVPTTIAKYRGFLYAVNARFGLPAGPYTIVKVDGK